MPSKVILTGATGTAGSEVLLQLLESTSISRVTVLSRRPLPAELVAALPAEAVKTKLNVIELSDFTSYPPEVMSQLEGYESCIWTLGVSYYLVEKEEYRRLTYDYAVAAAKTFSSLSPNFRFVFISGQGTSHWNPNLGMRIKAQTETALSTLFGSRAFLFRPGGIIPRSPPIPGVRERNLAERKMEGWVPMMERWVPSTVISTRDLAAALIDTALHGKFEGSKEARMFGNLEIREMGKRVREAGGAAEAE